MSSSPASASQNSSSPKPLSLRRQRFVEAYAQCWDGPTAARAAGYDDSQAEQRAQALLQEEQIQAAIFQECIDERVVSVEALSKLSMWARGTVEPFLQQDQKGEFIIDLTTAEARANYHLLKRVRQTRTVVETEHGPIETVETEIELHDAMQACYKLLCYQGALPAHPLDQVNSKEVPPSAEQPAPRVKPADRDMTDHINRRYRRHG